MFSSQDLVDGTGEILPRPALSHQRDAPLRGQPVEAAALTGLSTRLPRIKLRASRRQRIGYGEPTRN